MAFITFANKKVFYDYQPNEGPVIVFINGLTQSTKHWREYKNHLFEIGMSTLCFDIPGQGQSEIPENKLSFSDMAAVIDTLMSELNIPNAYVIGISFGGAIALHFALEYPNRMLGMIAIGGNSEKDTLFKCLHQALIDAIHKGGIAYLFDFLTALNFSHEWIEKNERLLMIAKQLSVANNSTTAIQNFLESILESRDITDKLHQINCPTLIMCGEDDKFTPRWCQEILRENMPNSNMVVIQNVCHAFTIESPAITKKIFAHFIRQMRDGEWVGQQTAWIAIDQDNDEFRLVPCKRRK
ncbi:MAG: alpha/beta fold hydrolase [Burkholderiaceae bacterium]